MQAVILLIEHDEWLQPLGIGGAWALALGRQRAVELTLRWLERSAINEAYLLTAPALAGPLAAYLRQAGWGESSYAATAVHVLTTPGCSSEGEALRYLKEKDVVKGDFVLVSGSVVGNVDLLPALQAHVARRGLNRRVLMTLLVHQASNEFAPGLDICLVVADPCSHQLLKLERSFQTMQSATMGTHLFGERDGLVVQSNLRLSDVYICAPEVLLLLGDNFDYQSVAGDLVPGVLSEQELGSTLYIHQLARGYAMRVGNRPDYVGIVEDVMNRWTYPWVPDNSGNQLDLCRFNRGFYIDASASVAPTSHISKSSYVGSGSFVDAGARLSRSIVGNDSHVGSGTTVVGSILYAHAQLKHNCKLSHSLLADQVLVRSHARIETGALLARRTVVDTAQCVPAGVCVSLVRRRSCADCEDELEWAGAESMQDGVVEAAAAVLAGGGIPETAVNFDEAVVGPFGAGFIWGIQGHGAWPAAKCPVVGKWTHVDCDSEPGDFTKDTVGEYGAPGLQLAAEDQFKDEVAETFLRCIKEDISHDNAVIELNGLKIAEDRTFADCARYIFTTMLSLCLPSGEALRAEYGMLFPQAHVDLQSKQGRLELLRRLNAQLKARKDLLGRFLKTTDDQVELLLTFEEFCAEEGDFAIRCNGSHFAGLFPQVVKLCYDHDLLCEDAILDWASEKENGAKEDRRFVEMCLELLGWLGEADEESSAGSD